MTLRPASMLRYARALCYITYYHLHLPKRMYARTHTSVCYGYEALCCGVDRDVMRVAHRNYACGAGGYVALRLSFFGNEPERERENATHIQYRHVLYTYVYLYLNTKSTHAYTYMFNQRTRTTRTRTRHNPSSVSAQHTAQSTSPQPVPTHF